MNIKKTATINWVTNYNRTPYPYSSQKAALKGLEPKQPVYFDGNNLKQVKWAQYQEWEKLDDNFKTEIIKVWHDNQKIEGVGCNAGWNGEFYFSMIDIDPKNFESLEVMEQAVIGWENRNPEVKLCPKVKTQSGGYRYIVGFQNINPIWGNTINFTFTQGGEKALGELMVGPGGLGILPPTVGLKGKYEWVANALGEVPVFESPDKIGIFEVVKIISNQNKKTYSGATSVDEARDALNHIPVTNFDDYQKWINIGMACKDAGLDFEDWDNWSRGSKKYSTSRENLQHWNSFKEGGITAATLFGFAKDAGWAGYGVQKNNKNILPKTNHQTSGNTVMKPEPESKSKHKSSKQEIKDAFKEVKKILLNVFIDDFDKDILIEEIKNGLSISNTLWQSLMNRTNSSVCTEKIKLELKALLQSDDKVDQEIELSKMAQKYRLSFRSLEKMLRETETKMVIPEYESIDFEQLYNSSSQAVDYLIPGLLPKGESALLVAMPKVGKSLMAVDAAFAVATGEDSFLGENCKQGKVLYVSVDESKQSVLQKMVKRGFRVQDKNNIQIVTKFSINQLSKLESEIETFKPVLVIIDSLKRITKGSVISENSAEFSDNVYTISELCNRYGASCLLIHHSNKNTETIGVENVRGSTAIAGACSNTWILNRVAKEDPINKKKFIFDPKDTKRQLYCYNRDSESKALAIDLNLENNSWTLLGDMGVSDEDALERKSIKERILKVFDLNQKHKPEGLSGLFILECLEYQTPGEVSKGSVYTIINRLVGDKILGTKPAPGDKRHTLYFLSGYGQNIDNQSQQKEHTTSIYTTQENTTSIYTTKIDNNFAKLNEPSPPPLSHPDVMQYAETYTEYEKKIDNTHIKLDNNYITPLDENIEKTPMLSIVLSNFNPDTEGVLGHKAKLDNNYITTRGGGQQNKNCYLSNSDAKNETDTTYSGEYGECPPIEYDLLVDGDVIFDVGCKPYTLKSLTVEGWECTNGSYVTKSNIHTFHHAPKSGWE